jgi:hypothetical protein
MEQFKIDCCRTTIYYGKEWVPSEDYHEVLTILQDIYKQKDDLSNAIVYFTQIPLAHHYKKEIAKFTSPNEHLLSFDYHQIVIDKVTKFLTVEKRFQYSHITEGEPYDIDFATLTITYDPFLDKELSAYWGYTIRNFTTDMGQSMILEDESMFVESEHVTILSSSGSSSDTSIRHKEA